MNQRQVTIKIERISMSETKEQKVDQLRLTFGVDEKDVREKLSKLCEAEYAKLMNDEEKIKLIKFIKEQTDRYGHARESCICGDDATRAGMAQHLRRPSDESLRQELYSSIVAGISETMCQNTDTLFRQYLYSGIAAGVCEIVTSTLEADLYNRKEGTAIIHRQRLKNAAKVKLQESIKRSLYSERIKSLMVQALESSIADSKTSKVCELCGIDETLCDGICALNGPTRSSRTAIAIGQSLIGDILGALRPTIVEIARRLVFGPEAGQ